MTKINAAWRLRSSIGSEEIFAMSGFKSDKTGLPNNIYIWVSTKLKGMHGPRIKVSNVRSKYINTNTFSVTISNSPKVVAGIPDNFSSKELLAIYNWVRLNKNPLLVFWNSDNMDSDDLTPLLKKI